MTKSWVIVESKGGSCGGIINRLMSFNKKKFSLQNTW